MMAGLTSPVLLCDGVEPDAVADFSRRHGVSPIEVDMAGDTLTAFHENTSRSANLLYILLMSDLSENRLANALKPPVQVCFEVSTSGDNLADSTFQEAHPNKAFISLSTLSAYGAQVDRYFVGWIAQRITLDEDLQVNLELALHEALANGLIHGNLGLETTLPNHVDELEIYGELVEARLNGAQFGQLQIEVSANWSNEFIELSVFDNGEGYSLDDPQKKSVTGRGLTLIHNLADRVEVSNGGQRITMRFLRG